jgi:flagellar basal-body rod modification protein FlgD
MLSPVSTGNYGAKNSNDLYTPETLGKEEFLKLLTMQLKYQNPLEPFENTEFIAQLTEFSSLEQLQNIGSNVQSQMLLTQATNNSLATTLIGKYVKTSGNYLQLREDGKGLICFDLAQDADVTINIYDENDVRVASLQEDGLSGGENFVEWDGLNLNSTHSPSGIYTFEVVAKDSSGNAVSAVTYTYGLVEGVKFEGGNALLIIDDIIVTLSSILEILAHEPASDDPLPLDPATE